jgi:hypothetical protein
MHDKAEFISEHLLVSYISVKIKVYPARRNNTKMWRNGLADLGAGQ